MNLWGINHKSDAILRDPNATPSHFSFTIFILQVISKCCGWQTSLPLESIQRRTYRCPTFILSVMVLIGNGLSPLPRRLKQWRTLSAGFSNTKAPYTDRQTYRHTDRQTDRYTDTQTHRHTDIHTDRQTDRQTHRHIHRHTDRQTDTQTQTDRHTDTDRQTDTQTHRQADTQTDIQTERQNLQGFH